MGYCFKDCKFIKGHIKNDEAEDNVIEEFVKKAREKRKSFLDRRRNTGSAPPLEIRATVPGN